MRGKVISWASPCYWGNELNYATNALQSSWISGGEYVDKLESDFANFCDIPHVASCSNGTSALHMAYLALNIGPGG